MGYSQSRVHHMPPGDILANLGAQRTAAAKSRHRHQYRHCDCRNVDFEVERNCCCVGGRDCWPENVCACGQRKDPAKSIATRSARRRARVTSAVELSRRGLRQVEIAERLGVAESTVSDYIREGSV